MSLFFFFLFLLLNWALLGLPPSPAYDDWSGSTFSLCYFEGLGAFMFFAKLSERKGFWGVELADFQGSSQLLTSSPGTR